MDNTQDDSEGHDDRRKKLWTYVFLGLIIGGSFLLRRRNIKKQRERADDERITASDMSPSDIKVQLDRIQKKVESIEGQLSRQEKTRRFYIWLSIGFAFIVASPSIGFGLYGIEKMKHLVPISVLVFLGGVMLLYSAGLEHSQSYHKRAASAAWITTSIGAAMAIGPLIFDKTAIIGWQTVMGIGILGVALGLILWVWVLSTRKSLKRKRA